MTEHPPTVETADGSITCFDAETGEHYHNRAGAFAEAYTHFVKPLNVQRLAHNQESICVLDVPFGLGYNSFVLLQELLKIENAPLKRIDIVGVEIDGAVLQLIDLVLQCPRLALLRDALGTSLAELTEAIKCFSPIAVRMTNLQTKKTLRLSLHVRQGDLRQIVPELVRQDKAFDAIMHDAFSPNKMPELWTTDLFKLYRQMLSAQGRISTYSVSVAVRAGLLEAGFTAYGTSPLGAKSGGTLASLGTINNLEDGIAELTSDEKLRLSGRSGIPYRDKLGLNLTRSEIRKQRLQEQEAR